MEQTTELTIDRAPDQATGQTTAQVQNSESHTALRVLVIDDNKAHADGLAELLCLAGFEAWRSLTGSEGIESARALNVDAVLLDMNLPDMNGFEVCRRLRRDPRTASVAVVFHTAQGSIPGARHEGDAFLTYPVAMSEVYATIRASIERRKNRMGRIIE
jgi:DNA-binding response OmpR family regulator